MSRAVAPSIETTHLVLRPHRLDDCAHFAAFHGTDASRFVGGPPSLDARWHRIASGIGQWVLVGFGPWAVEERATGDFAGQIALNGRAYFPEPELGWILRPALEGGGIAFEVATAALAWAYGTLGLSALVSYIAPRNARSIALASRLGAVEDPEAERQDAADLAFRRPDAEGLG